MIVAVDFGVVNLDLKVNRKNYWLPRKFLFKIRRKQQGCINCICFTQKEIEKMKTFPNKNAFR